MNLKKSEGQGMFEKTQKRLVKNKSVWVPSYLLVTVSDCELTFSMIPCVYVLFFVKYPGSEA